MLAGRLRAARAQSRCPAGFVPAGYLAPQYILAGDFILSLHGSSTIGQVPSPKLPKATLSVALTT